MSKETLFAPLFVSIPWLPVVSHPFGSNARLALVGFYMTLVFVAVTIPAGIYAQVVYQESLANVDALHGAAEFFLTLSNILVVLGFRQAIRARVGAIAKPQPSDNSTLSPDSEH